jgi:hypothetical protein
MRAGHLGTRGMVRLALAVLGSYASQSPEVASIDRNQAEILKLVDAYTGDGTFQTQIGRDAAGRTVSVRAWDKQLSRVVPGIGAAVIGVAFFAAASSGGSSKTAMPPPAAAPATQPMPKKKRATP